MNVKRGFLFICIIMVIAAIVLYYFEYNVIRVLVSSLCIIVFALYLIYDTKLIMQNFINAGEKAMTCDDYILGAFLIFTDIIMLFIEILELFTFLCRSNE